MQRRTPRAMTGASPPAVWARRRHPAATRSNRACPTTTRTKRAPLKKGSTKRSTTKCLKRPNATREARDNMAGKIIRFPGKRRGGTAKPPADRPERFLTEEFHIGRREDHTQNRFVPVAMNRSLGTTSRWAEP